MSIAPKNNPVPERKKVLALASKFNKVACNIWHDLLWPYADDVLKHVPRGNAPFSDADRWECINALLGVGAPLVMLKKTSDGSFSHSAFTDTEEQFIKGAANFIGALIAFSNALEEHRRQFSQFYVSIPSARARTAYFTIVEELNPCLEDIRKARHARTNEHAQAKEDIEIIRASNPFGLPEGVEDFEIQSIWDAAKKNEYGAQLRQHLETWKGDALTPGDKRLLSRAELEQFLRYLSEHQRKKP